MFAIVAKVLYEKRFGLLGWSLGAAALAWFSIIFYPAISEGNTYQELTRALPPQLQAFVGDAMTFKTIGGYLDTQVFGLRMPMITLTLAIIMGIYLSAGDEERGTMATLLAQPVSRTRVLFEKYIALKVYLLIVHIGLLAGIQAVLWIIDEPYALSRLLALVFGCYVISLLFGTLAFSLGLITGRKNVAAASTAVVAIGSYVITSMAPTVAALQTVQKTLPFYYYVEPRTGINGVDWMAIGVQIIFMLVFLAIAWVIFRHRDIQSA